MAVKIGFDSEHNVIEPTFVLCTRKGRKLGKMPSYSLVFKGAFNTYDEISFKVNKSDCGAKFWEQIVDFKLLWVREWNKLFEIYVEIDETNDTIKNVSAMSLGEAELSQIMLYDIEINTENDILREDYKEPTILYDELHPERSLLSRIIEKAPNYVVKHVDATIAGIQRTFTFDDTSLLDAFYAIGEEIDCIFIINCTLENGGRVLREINVYDLESNCYDCKERGVFTGACPNCGSKNITTGYGEDTTIFVSTDNLADCITYSTDTGAVKNCFRLEAGDDLMTATVINCNPNGSAYIWYISDDMKKDMSAELVKKLEQYDKDYAYYQTEYEADVSGDILTKYNALVEKYKTYTENYTKITSPIAGYSSLMENYYNTIDFHQYLAHTMMPDIELPDTNARVEAQKLNAANLAPVAVRSLSSCSKATADNAVLGVAKVLVNGNYQVKIASSSYETGRWRGSFIVTNYSDKEDTATSTEATVTISEDYEGYVRQKIHKALRQSSNEDDVTEIIKIFELPLDNFRNTMKLYSLSQLTSFYDCCQSCLDVLTEQGVGNNQTWASQDNDLYTTMYLPYYTKLGYISEEMAVREDEIATVYGLYDNNGGLLQAGMQTVLDEQRDFIHDKLDFEKYLGTDLWLEFAAYRREDTYKNENYISDGLDNAELFENAREFFAVAQKEIFKSATLQHSITSTLKNLLVMKEFEPIVDYFEVGNWLRISVDGKVYRLRLLEYEIDFTDLDNLSITFSDVTTVANGTTDVNSVLSQAASVVSSYDTTKRQAKKGDTSKGWLDNWVQRGLDATNVKIVSNADNQHQTWDSHGMLFRAYDNIIEDYEDTQLKIINSTLAVTDDKWKTIKTAVGGFYYFDPVTGELKYNYGVNAEMLIGKVILGENLGIYSDNNALTFDKDGLTITNKVNTFKVNPNDENLLVLSNAGGNILWVDDKGGLHIVGDGAELDITMNDSVTGLSAQITATAAEVTSILQNYSTTEEMNQAISSQIQQTASSITSMVSETYSTKTETQQVKTDAAADATTKANNAEKNANNATDEKLKKYSTTTEMQSAIQQTASSITSTVEQTINSMELVRGDVQDMFENREWNNGTVLNPSTGGGSGTVLARTTLHAINYAQAKGKHVQFTVDYKITKSITGTFGINCWIYYADSTANPNQSVVLATLTDKEASDEWITLSGYIDARDVDPTDIYMHAYILDGGNGEIELRNAACYISSDDLDLQLKSGDDILSSTKFMNPEIVQQRMRTEIKQTVESITMSVQSTATVDLFKNINWTGSGTREQTVTNGMWSYVNAPNDFAVNIMGGTLRVSAEIKVDSAITTTQACGVAYYVNYPSGNNVIGWVRMFNGSHAVESAWQTFTVTATMKTDELPIRVYVAAYMNGTGSYSVRNVTGVLNGAQTTALTLKAGETTLSSANILISGMVTFKNLATGGETVINGNNITTGQISANLIKTGVVQSNDGTTIYNLDKGTIQMGATNSAHIIITDRKVQWYENANNPLGLFYSEYAVSYIGATSHHVYLGWITSSPNTSVTKKEPYDTHNYYGVRIEESAYAHFNVEKVECNGKYDSGAGTLEAATVKAGGRTISLLGSQVMVASTKDYGDISLVSAGSPSPTAFDSGSGIIDETGKCYLFLSDEFASTVSTNVVPQWQITPTSETTIPLTVQKDGLTAIVSGEPGVTFDWMCIMPQNGCETIYCEPSEVDMSDGIDRKDYVSDYELEIIDNFERGLDEEVLSITSENDFIEGTWAEQVEKGGQ